MRNARRDSVEIAWGVTVRFCAAVVAVLILSSPVTQGQTLPNSSGQTSGQLATVIKQVRAEPSDTGKIATARDIGFGLLAASRYEDAWSIFNAILDVSPRDQQALYGGALALFNLRQIGQAEQLARTAFEAASITSRAADPQNKDTNIETNSRASDALVLLGVILAVKGDGEGSLKVVERAVALAPGNFDAQLALGRARFGANDLARAATAFRAAVLLRPNDVKARFFLATALEGAGNYESALAAYRELITVQPDSAEGHLGLGVLLVKLGGEKTGEGINELIRATALNGDLYEARATLGRTLIQVGRAAEAVEHLRRAAVLAPRNPEPHYQLMIAYRRLGKTAEASAEAAIVKKLHEARKQ